MLITVSLSATFHQGRVCVSLERNAQLLQGGARQTACGSPKLWGMVRPLCTSCSRMLKGRRCLNRFRSAHIVHTLQIPHRRGKPWLVILRADTFWCRSKVIREAYGRDTTRRRRALPFVMEMWREAFQAGRTPYLGV